MANCCADQSFEDRSPTGLGWMSAYATLIFGVAVCISIPFADHGWLGVPAIALTLAHGFRLLIFWAHSWGHFDLMPFGASEPDWRQPSLVVSTGSCALYALIALLAHTSG